LEQNKNTFLPFMKISPRQTLMPARLAKFGTVKVHALIKMKIIHSPQIAGVSLDGRAHWAQNEMISGLDLRL
jgi:hypothetical protein